MPKSLRQPLLAALGQTALQLRCEQDADVAGVHDAILAETAARHQARGKAWQAVAMPNAPEQPSWQSGAVIVTIGRTRFVLRACYTVIEAFAHNVRRMPARLLLAPAFTIERDRRPLSEALAADLARAKPAPRPEPAPQPWPDPADLPQPWPDPADLPKPFEPADLAARRSAAARLAMANRDRFAAGRKAAATRRARKALPAIPAGPPPFLDWVAERIGTRRFAIAPVRRRERALFDRIISEEWYGELRATYARNYADG
jgi:hypothetical protein